MAERKEACMANRSEAQEQASAKGNDASAPMQAEALGQISVQRQSALTLQRAQSDPASLTAVDVKILQRSIGNRSTVRLLKPLLQAKLTLGSANDPYEQEADQVAQQVVNRMTSPAMADRSEEAEVQRLPVEPPASPLISRTPQPHVKRTFTKSLLQRQHEREDEEGELAQRQPLSALPVGEVKADQTPQAAPSLKRTFLHSPKSGVLQRTLTERAKRAFSTAEPHNPTFGFGDKTKPDLSITQYRDATDKFATASEQDTISTVRGKVSRLKSSPEGEKELKDYLRAFLLSRYAHSLYYLEQSIPADKITAPKRKEKTKKKATYFEKAKKLRDKMSPLVSKGVAAPETQGFLRTYGFEGGVKVTDQQRKDALAQGPRVDVRSTFIAGPVLGINLRAHLFIVYTASDGTQYYLRGGPDSGGYTVADMGVYSANTIDYDPSAPSVTVLQGPKAKEKFDAMVSATMNINAMKVPYEATIGKTAQDGENCNATAWTILDVAGVPKNKPTGIHPGWGHRLGATSKKGTPMAGPEDDTAPGTPMVIKGKKTDAVDIYTDRLLAEKLTTVAGETDVEAVQVYGSHSAKIRYSGKIGFVRAGDIVKPREAGRPFKITGDEDDYVSVYRLDAMMGSGEFLDAGTVVEVLDGDFTLGEDYRLVRIRWNNGPDELMGRVYGQDLADISHKPKPKASIPKYPTGKIRFKLDKPTEFQVSDTETGPIDATFTVNTTVGAAWILVLEDLMKKNGRGKLMHNGKNYYVELAAVAALGIFGEEFKPKVAEVPAEPTAVLGKEGGDKAQDRSRDEAVEGASKLGPGEIYYYERKDTATLAGKLPKDAISDYMLDFEDAGEGWKSFYWVMGGGSNYYVRDADLAKLT
jgi:hypothetical protein